MVTGVCGLDLSVNLAALPDNCATLEALPRSRPFLSLTVVGFKVEEVPFGSHPLWFFLLLVPANAVLGTPGRFRVVFFPLLVIDHVVAMFHSVSISSY